MQLKQEGRAKQVQSGERGRRRRRRRQRRKVEEGKEKRGEEEEGMDLLKELERKRKSVQEDFGGKKIIRRSEIEQKKIDKLRLEEEMELEAKSLMRNGTGNDGEDSNPPPPVSTYHPSEHHWVGALLGKFCNLRKESLFALFLFSPSRRLPWLPFCETLALLEYTVRWFLLMLPEGQKQLRVQKS